MTATPLLTVAHRQAAQKKLCEDSFAEFIRLSWAHVDTSPFVPNWHIRVLAEHLQAAFEGRSKKRLLINIPPGSAKSLIIGVMFPAWCWTRDPTKRIISTANSRKLAIRDSNKCRRLIESNWYQKLWPTKLLEDQNSKENFENGDHGARLAMPITSMTGERGNIVIVDDPHTVDSAKSAADRSSTVETFREAIPTRLNNPSEDIIIVVMQRLHEEDVAGMILENPGLGYDHLCIPLYADDEDRPATSLGWIDHREEGENMFPARYTEAVIAEYKASLGPFQFAGQFQQRPAPATDGFFQRDWFRRYTDIPKHLNHYMTSDHAPSGKGDWNVFRIWGVDSRRNLYLIDSFRKKCLMDEAIGVVRDENGKAQLAEFGALPLIKKYRPLGWYPENDPTWSAMKSFVLSAMIETQALCRIDPLPLKGAGDKVGKAQAYQAVAAMGMVHLPVGPIGDDALAEYAMFPGGKHDDQVDADGAIARVLADAIPAFVPAPQAQQRPEWHAAHQQSDGWY